MNATNVHVTRNSLAKVIDKLNKRDLLVFDTETTGLKPYNGATMFSLAVSDGEDNYYFNFKEYQNFSPSYPFHQDYYLEKSWLKPLTDRKRTWVAHNAKFDLHFMDRAGIKPVGPVIDTEVMARIYNNNHTFSGGYGLDACAARWLGMRKDDRVKEWMEQNGAHTTHHRADGRAEKIYFFDQVPFQIISEYAMMDAEITFKLYQFLLQGMYPNSAHDTEIKLTSVLFEMEKLGILVDRTYCKTALDAEVVRVRFAENNLKTLCGGEFTDSAKFLAPLLEARGFKLPVTPAGNKQVTDEVLGQFPNDPLAISVLAYRDATKRADTYYSAYLYMTDNENTVHPNFRQAGTVTGRMSCNNPNLQNIPAEDNSEFPIRRSFIPRPGFTFVSIDYAQMEFRLMLEYANQTDLIEKIKAGHDPHDSTAELTGLSRKSAKTLNFGLLYGMGIKLLAKNLGVSDEEAKSFKWTYFGKLPGVKRFIRTASDAQASRGFTFNWTGRRYYIDDPKWSYKAANCIIQGGCADICKLAMVHLENYLRENQSKSRMVIQIHDEVLFEIHESELQIIPDLKRIMADAYEAKNMPLTCSVSFSTKNFHDMTEVEADEAENAIRKELSGASESGPKKAQEHVGVSPQ